eukprot:c49752_g1_i1.p2 GENE.c49752_g1_i1~~c49752_g1_i1.p2  ORF type:complete len:150 (+),score=32.04 c49752_g1_i1:34-450(+)
MEALVAKMKAFILAAPEEAQLVLAENSPIAHAYLQVLAVLGHVASLDEFYIAAGAPSHAMAPPVAQQTPLVITVLEALAASIQGVDPKLVMQRLGDQHTVLLTQMLSLTADQVLSLSPPEMNNIVQVAEQLIRLLAVR